MAREKSWRALSAKSESARVKLNYDTANVIFYGGVNPVQDLKTCLAETAYIHHQG